MLTGYDYQLPSRRRPQIGYGGYYDQEPTVDQEPISEEEREDLLSHVSGMTGQATNVLLDWLDAPGRAVRQALTGKSDPGEMLDAMGLRPDDESLLGFARPIADFAAGVATDPLSYLGVGSLTKAGALAKSAGLIDDAARAASAAAIRSGNIAGAHADDALNFFRGAGRGMGSANPLDVARDISPMELASRPLIGPRVAKKNMDLGALVREQTDSLGATGNLMQKAGGSRPLSQLMGQRLTNDIGITLPFSDRSLVGFNIPGGQGLAAGLDRAGQIARWSYPGRFAHSLFNKNVMGATEQVDQVMADSLTRHMDAGDSIARGKLFDDSYDAAPLLEDPANSQAFRRYIETGGTAADQALIAQHPELQQFAVTVRERLKNERIRRMSGGMAANELNDPYGTQFFPRHIDDYNFQGRVDQGDGGGLLASMAGEQTARQDYLKVPGGTASLNDPALYQAVRGANSRLDAAHAVRDYMNNRMRDPDLFPGGMASATPPQMPGTRPLVDAAGELTEPFSTQQAQSIADLILGMDQNAVTHNVPLFGKNVLDDYQRYLLGGERSIRGNEFLQEMLVKNSQVALDANGDFLTASRAPGNNRSIPEALQQLKLRTSGNPDNPLALAPGQMQEEFLGSAPQVLAKLKARFGSQVDELANAHIDRDHLARLSRLGDYYNDPGTRSQFVQTWDNVTRVWRNSLLSWPAKFARDWYGGVFINTVQTGGGQPLWEGYTATKALIQGDLDGLDAVLRKINRYSDVATPAERLKAFRRDMFQHGGIESSRNMDLQSLAQNVQSGTKTIDAIMPGRNPRTTVGYQVYDKLTGKQTMPLDTMAESELFQNWDNFMEMGRDNERNVLNPILRWGQRLGDTTENMNRMSGTLAMMLKGADPEVAIKAMKKAHTDPSSLTRFEREHLRRFFPFWSFTSRIGSWVGQQLLERPGGRFTQLGLRLPNEMFQSGDEYVPESIRANYGGKAPQDSGLAKVPIIGKAFGGHIMGAPKEGVTPWLTDVDLPGIDTINMLRPSYDPQGGLSASGTAFNTLEDFVGRNAAPGVKGLLEAFSGVDSYTKRPLKETESAPQQLLEKVTGIGPESTIGSLVGRAKPIIDTLPFASRVFQTTNRLLDSERVEDPTDRLYQLLVNATSGVKFQNIDDQIRRIDARKKIADLLADDPMVRSMSQVYVPEELKARIDPMTLKLLALDRQLGREVKRERQTRRGEVVSSRKRKRAPDPVSYFD